MRNRQSLTLSLLVGGILLAAPLVAQVGGTIKGKVTFTGKVPPPKEFAFSKFPNVDFCKKNTNKSADGETRLLKEVEVDGNKGLKHAVVLVTSITDKDWMKGFKNEPAQKVMAELCEFLPFTGVSVSKGLFYVENNDADPDDPRSSASVCVPRPLGNLLRARSVRTQPGIDHGDGYGQPRDGNRSPGLSGLWCKSAPWPEQCPGLLRHGFVSA